jgi:hypothetical protein
MVISKIIRLYVNYQILNKHFVLQALSDVSILGREYGREL